MIRLDLMAGVGDNIPEGGARVTWQEELRKLDEELAAGRLAADDYRVRRDQVLSSAVTTGESGQTPQQQPPQDAGSTQIISPVSPPPPQQPMSPPHGFQQQGYPQQPGAESTQFVPSRDLSAERTQAVPSWQTKPPSDPERTQVVPGGHPGPPQHNPSSPAGGFPQPPYQQQQQPQQQQPWNAPENDLSPPWGGSDFPPIAPAGSSEWIKQGPETFETAGKSNKKGIFAIIGVLVLVAAGVAVWLIVANSGDDNKAQPPQPTSQTEPSQAPAPKSVLELLPNPPGQAGSTNGPINASSATGDRLLSAQEATAVRNAGVTNITHKGSKDGDFYYETLAFEVGDATKAAALKQSLNQAQLSSGLVPGANGKLDEAKVVVHQQVKPQISGVYRALYVSDTKVIWIAVTQDPGGADDKTLIDKFQAYAPKVSDAIAPS